RLYLQNLDEPEEARAILHTEGAVNPFFSSDGKWLAFIAGDKLQKLALNGGEPVILADAAPLGVGGGVWSPDDQAIYFVPAFDRGIWKISSGGGTPVQITKPDHDGFDNSHL